MFTFVIEHVDWKFSMLIPNVMYVAYAIVKIPHDETYICCMTFTYVYNKLWTFVSLHNKWIVLFDIFLLLAFLNSILYKAN
jgi:hypothetical protein